MTSLTAWRLRTVLAALAIPPAVHAVSLARLCRWLEPGSSTTGDDEPPPAATIAWWVDRVLRVLPWPWRHTCLKRATTLYYLLRRAGLPVGLQVGVRRQEGGDLEAHAWLTLDGAPFLEPPSSSLVTFSPIATFGP